MNKRIREIMEQAMESTGVEGLGGCYMELNPEKLVELVVLECAEVCSTHEMADEPFGVKSYRKGRHFDVMIRQHFGVKQ